MRIIVMQKFFQPGLKSYYPYGYERACKHPPIEIVESINSKQVKITELIDVTPYFITTGFRQACKAKFDCRG